MSSGIFILQPLQDTADHLDDWGLSRSTLPLIKIVWGNTYKITLGNTYILILASQGDWSRMCKFGAVLADSDAEKVEFKFMREGSRQN